MSIFAINALFNSLVLFALGFLILLNKKNYLNRDLRNFSYFTFLYFWRVKILPVNDIFKDLNESQRKAV